MTGCPWTCQIKREPTWSKYFLVIKHGNGKSHVHGGVNWKIIQKKMEFSIAMFGHWRVLQLQEQLQIAKMVPNRPQNHPICGKRAVYHPLAHQLRVLPGFHWWALAWEFSATIHIYLILIICNYMTYRLISVDTHHFLLVISQTQILWSSLRSFSTLYQEVLGLERFHDMRFFWDLTFKKMARKNMRKNGKGYVL